jgi:hypothetical protein
MYLPASRSGLGALNCPGDPGCPGNPLQIGPTTEVIVPASGPAQYFDVSSGTPVQIFPQTAPQTFTQWMNANSTLLLVGAGGFLALLFVMKAAR